MEKYQTKEERGDGILVSVASFLTVPAILAIVSKKVSKDIAKYAPLLSNILPVVIPDNQTTEDARDFLFPN